MLNCGSNIKRQHFYLFFNVKVKCIRRTLTMDMSTVITRLPYWETYCLHWNEKKTIVLWNLFFFDKEKHSFVKPPSLIKGSPCPPSLVQESHTGSQNSQWESWQMRCWPWLQLEHQSGTWHSPGTLNHFPTGNWTPTEIHLLWIPFLAFCTVNLQTSLKSTSTLVRPSGGLPPW